MNRVEKDEKRVHILFIMFVLAGILLLPCCSTSTTEGGQETSFSLKFSPESATIPGTGQTTDVSVTVENAPPLVTARFTISFNSSLVEVTTIKTSGSGFLFSDAGAQVNVLEKNYDNEKGTIVVGIGGVKQGFTGASGNGTLAMVTFKGKNSGSGNLTFVSSKADDIFMAKYSAGSDKGWEKAEVKTATGTLTVQ
jgi:hypothetical protein